MRVCLNGQVTFVGITNSQTRPSRRGRSSPLPRRQFHNRRSCPWKARPGESPRSACSQSIAKGPQAGKLATGFVAAALQAGHAHQAANLDMGEHGQLGENRFHLLGSKPLLGRLAQIFTSNKTGTVRSILPAASAMASAKRRLSTEWIIVTSGSVRSTLFAARAHHVPSHGQIAEFGGRSQSRCGRLSPRSVQPAATRPDLVRPDVS